MQARVKVAVEKQVVANIQSLIVAVGREALSENEGRDALPRDPAWHVSEACFFASTLRVCAR